MDLDKTVDIWFLSSSLRILPSVLYLYRHHFKYFIDIFDFLAFRHGYQSLLRTSWLHITYLEDKKIDIFDHNVLE